MIPVGEYSPSVSDARLVESGNVSSFYSRRPYNSLAIFRRAVGEGHGLVGIILYDCARLHFHKQRFEVAPGMFGAFAPHCAENPVASLHQLDAHIAGIQLRIFPRNDILFHFSEGSGDLHTCRVSAHNHECEQLAASARVAAERCLFEILEYLVACAYGFVDGLYPES